MFASVANPELETFLRNNFDATNETISLDYFLTTCLYSYFPKSNFSKEVLKHTYLALQTDITTVDMETISLNALELTLKKRAHTLKGYIEETLLAAKYSCKQNKLQSK